ncbi:MAG: RNA polymerase sigma factor [Planctomycetes bacterium]|nr:RNA polymerase sigma factor [Planctomycetota bacterium]MBL7008689.1 RNA polymerase sigma factor [Planctomycetota bacterium]
MTVDAAPRSLEQELLDAALGGDRQAFGELALLHQPRAIAMAAGILGSREEARDLVQESCLKAYRALDTFVPGRPFFPWFYRILRNSCIQQLRRRKVRRTSSLTRTNPDEEPAPELADAAAPLPEDIVARDERSDLVGQALIRLPASDREILMLKHFDGLTYKEIAAALSIPVGTVMSRISTARQRLRKLLPDLASS